VITNTADKESKDFDSSGFKKVSKTQETYRYNKEAFNAFMKTNQFQRLICGNNSSHLGFKLYFGDQLVSISSTPSSKDGKCAAILVSNQNLRLIRMTSDSHSLNTTTASDKK
jgi:hypothetical protein